jgi:hypothetical protein
VSIADRELLLRLDEHMARGNELMEQIREEHRLNRKQHELNRKEHQLNRAAVQDMRKVAREVILEMRENRVILRDIQHGIRAQTEGLLHVLNELRRPGGQAPA